MADRLVADPTGLFPVVFAYSASVFEPSIGVLQLLHMEALSLAKKICVTYLFAVHAMQATMRRM
jgi:hypothetical protein